ncbi:MAG: aromatic ring-hydroxylating dioxygenase subunit alpha [Terriglobales bacterium]
MKIPEKQIKKSPQTAASSRAASVAEIVAAYDAAAPLAEASTIPAAWYLDARIAELERQTVFSRSWQVVGRVDQVAGPGQFVTANVAGEPIVVVRDNAVRGGDGALRAFFNVCRHHAAAVVTEPCGQAAILHCPYHGWNYGLDGSLKGMPEFEGVLNFDRKENGLVPVKVDTWEQFVFVNLDREAAPIAEFVGSLAGRVAPLALSNLHYFTTKTYDIACNWKVFVDNYLDGGYHVPHLHKRLSSVLDYKQYTIENEDRYCLQSSPMVSSDEDAATGATRKGDRAWYFWLYPNFMFNCYEGYLDTNLVIPLDADHCRVVFDFYFSDVSEAARAYNEESVAVGHRVQDEDIGICEAVQRGLKSRAYGAGRLSVRREAGEHWFHRLLAADLKNEL